MLGLCVLGLVDRLHLAGSKQLIRKKTFIAGMLKKKNVL